MRSCSRIAPFMNPFGNHACPPRRRPSGRHFYGACDALERPMNKKGRRAMSSPNLTLSASKNLAKDWMDCRPCITNHDQLAKVTRSLMSCTSHSFPLPFLPSRQLLLSPLLCHGARAAAQISPYPTILPPLLLQPGKSTPFPR